MEPEWHTNMQTVFELAEFMVESDQITTAKELLEYFKHPYKYTEVWNLYQIEIHGKHLSHKSNSYPRSSILLALAK